uniref:Uncharacterized protein n=1 Tax=Ditylenchus dipsaci TaxID=166011 RepID=A0A915DKT9_9BILA
MPSDVWKHFNKSGNKAVCEFGDESWVFEPAQQISSDDVIEFIVDSNLSFSIATSHDKTRWEFVKRTDQELAKESLIMQ